MDQPNTSTTLENPSAKPAAKQWKFKLKRWEIVLIGAFVVAIVGFLFYKLVYKKFIAPDNGGGSNGGSKDCKALMECSSSSDCCDTMTCKPSGSKKLCMYANTSPELPAFQLLFDNKCLILDSNQLKLVDTCNWEAGWWSWDGSTIRYLYIDHAGAIQTACMSGDIVVHGSVQVVDSTKCSAQANKLVLTFEEGVGSIFDKNFQYCVLMSPVGDSNLLEPVWAKCVDVPDGTGTVFKIDTQVSGKCRSPGQTCKSSLDCCPPFSNCQDDTCVVCKGAPVGEDGQPCPYGTQAVCQSNGQWQCVSKCDPTKKGDVKCDDSSAPACEQVGDSWEWKCVSNCGGELPLGCPQSTCQKGSDGKWDWVCDATCKAGTVHPAEPTDLVNQLTSAGFKQVDRKLCLPSDDHVPNATCFQKDKDFRLLMFDCESGTAGQWTINSACDANAEKCGDGSDPLCLEKTQFCDNNPPGYISVCANPPYSNWCEFTAAEANKGTTLARVNAVLDGDETKSVQIYEGDGVPIYPAISYDNCSQTGKNTIKLDPSISVNPAGFVRSTGSGTSLKYTMYPANASGKTAQGGDFVYWDPAKDSSHHYAYYTPEDTSPGNYQPYCMMDNPCTTKDPAAYLQARKPVGNYSMISSEDGRASGSNAPPTTEEIRKIATCVCSGTNVGYLCTEDTHDYCNKAGIGKTDETGCYPDPGVVCQCDSQHAGFQCQTTRAYCSSHGNPLGGSTCSNGKVTPTPVTCNCDDGWLGDKCQYSDGTTCSGHGKVDANGNCTCDSGWLGDHCNVQVGKTMYRVLTYGCSNVGGCNCEVDGSNCIGAKGICGPAPTPPSGGTVIWDSNGFVCTQQGGCYGCLDGDDGDANCYYAYKASAESPACFNGHDSLCTPNQPAKVSSNPYARGCSN